MSSSNLDSPANKTQDFWDSAPALDFMSQTVGGIESALVLLGFATQTKTVLPPAMENDSKDDFEWFASGELDSSAFRGKYIAIWRREVVGSGDSAIEAERLARANRGQDCKPLTVFVPQEEETIL
jgi:hypothetical protein